MTVQNDALVGTTFDSRYQIIKRVGAGGMARVYLARDETLGRSVAIKILDQRHSADGAFVERFLREASAAAKLNHPNIVQVYDRGEANETYYIAMEYVDGTTLKDVITNRGPFSNAETIGFARQALHALGFAHRNGIVHRDIKPHNMMIDADGALKIADFGIARAGSDAGLTEVGSIVGTAQYLSPEQARGEVVSAASDLYSLGVVMFEMATGRVPFDGDSPVNIALKQVSEAPPIPHTINPHVSGALEAIIMRAMQKDPDMRFQTADDFLQDLERAERGIIPAGTAAITQVIPNRANVGSAGATTVLPSTPIPAAYAGGSPSSYATSTLDAVQPPLASKRKRWPWVVLALLIAGVAIAAIIALSSGEKEPTTIAVPNVVGMTEAEARTALEDAGFEVGDVTEQFSDTKEVGIVLAEDPSAGTEADPTLEEIDLVVSKGAAPETIPDVVGTEFEDARAELTAAGFRVVKRLENSDTVEAGIVISTSPKAGTKAKKGSTVTVSVSKGTAKVVVPDVIGMSLSNAKTTLQAAGFTVTSSTQDGTSPANEVLDQSPNGNAEADDGSNVTLTVASGYNTVPDVVGQTEGDATTALEDAGFEISVTEVVDPTAPEEGVVSMQSPSGNTRLKLGNTVTITVKKPA